MIRAYRIQNSCFSWKLFNFYLKQTPVQLEFFHKISSHHDFLKHSGSTFGRYFTDIIGATKLDGHKNDHNSVIFLNFKKSSKVLKTREKVFTYRTKISFRKRSPHGKGGSISGWLLPKNLPDIEAPPSTKTSFLRARFYMVRKLFSPIFPKKVGFFEVQENYRVMIIFENVQFRRSNDIGARQFNLFD